MYIKRMFCHYRVSPQLVSPYTRKAVTSSLVRSLAPGLEPALSEPVHGGISQPRHIPTPADNTILSTGMYQLAYTSDLAVLDWWLIQL